MFEGPPQAVIVVARELKLGGVLCGNARAVRCNLSPNPKTRKMASWNTLRAVVPL